MPNHICLHMYWAISHWHACILGVFVIPARWPPNVSWHQFCVALFFSHHTLTHITNSSLYPTRSDSFCALDGFCAPLYGTEKYVVQSERTAHRHQCEEHIDGCVCSYSSAIKCSLCSFWFVLQTVCCCNDSVILIWACVCGQCSM